MEVFIMRKNCGIIVEKGCEIIKTIFEQVSLKAYAEENPNDGDDKGGEGNPDEKNDDSSNKSAPINYEDLIAKARKEEKEKQYKAIEKLKTQVNTLTEQHNNDLLTIASLEEKLKEAKENLTKADKGDTEEIITLKENLFTLTKEKEDLEAKVKAFEDSKPASREEIEAEIRAELEAEYEVKTYKATQLAELKDDILVPELVFGNTKEEIDASIKTALDRSAEIKKSLGVGEKKEKRTPKSPSNPSVGGVQDKGYSLEYLASLDVSSPEYAEVRKQLGLR